MMIKNKCSFISFSLILILLLLPSLTSAATITATSCSQTDVQAAIDAAKDGDTVMVPAGECTWYSPSYSILNDGHYPAVGINKSIKLIGAGINLAIITDATPNLYDRYLLRIKNVNAFRISGFTFRNLNDTAIVIYASKNWRIDNCRFINGSSGVETYGDSPYGVIDSCIFDGPQVMVFDNGTSSWNRPLTLGTKDAVYVENNIFYEYRDCGNDAIDGRSGGRIVFRNNELHNENLHLHGTDGGGERGTFSFEYYGNRLYDDAGLNCYRYASIRGGSGVIWNNSAFGNWGSFTLEHNCACTTDPNDSRCGGAKFCTGYPCLDQIGRTTDSNGDGIQDLAPLFIWNNTDDGTTKNVTVTGCDIVINTYIKENRDFYKDSVSYNSSTGFYYAQYIDDDGSVKQWTYTPYIYPHPLTVAPFGAKICGEGPIVSECWCQGMKSSGYCCYGYYQMNECGGVIQQISGDINSDGLVNIFDLVAIGIDFGKRSGLIHAKSDTNNDGIVDIFDIVYVASRYAFN